MKIMKISVLLLAAAVLIFPGSATGQDRNSGTDQKKKEKARQKSEAGEKEKAEETKLFQLDEVVIDVIEKARDADIPNMSVVKPELFPMGIGTTLDTALERQAGVDIQRIQEVGTAMDDDSVKIRGLGARRIKVLKNGRPLNTSGAAGGYFIDFTMIPLAGVDRIEVVKGVGDPRYGNVLGGIINLVPRRLPTGKPVTELQASAASFGTSGANLFHAWKPGAFEYSLTAGMGSSDGYLSNGSMKLGNADLHLGCDLPFAGRLTADLSYSRIRKGFIVPNRRAKSPDSPGYTEAADSEFPASDGEFMYGGMGAYPEPGSWWRKTKWLLDVGYEQAFGESGLLRASYWQNHGNREAFNTRAALGRTFHKLFFDDRSRGFSADYRHIAGKHTFTAGVDFLDLKDDGERNYSDDFRAPYRIGSYVETRNLEFYVMADFSLAGGKLHLAPGARYLSSDGIAGPSGRLEGIPDIRTSGLAPSIKLTWETGGGNLVYFSLARALRTPAAPEYYWHYSPDAGVYTGRTPFYEEDGIMVQAGWRTVLVPGTRIDIAPYYYDIKNYIQFDLINFIAYNIDRAALYGIEIEVIQPFGRGWTAFANATFQRSRTSGDRFENLFVVPEDRGFSAIPGLPRHSANVGLQYKTARNASIAVYAKVLSGRKVLYNDNTLYNTNLRVRDQKSSLTIDVEGRFPLFMHFEAGVFVRNLLDERYQERFGFPAAGRSAGISLRTTF
jgi:outer membrane receptor protein involved in Fe transport